MRICLVTPFAWSVPHDVNDHVSGVAAELRKLGHTVTVLAPSSHGADLREGRRALRSGADADVIALGPSVPISRRSSMGVNVGARANLTLALANGYEVVHGFEPGLPSLSYLALRHARTIAVASFFSAERLGYPPGKAQREKLLGRIDALLASSEATAHAAAERFPGDYRIVSPGVDARTFRPGRKKKLIVLEWRGLERPVAKSVIRILDELPGWELTLLRTRPLSGSPYVPRRLIGRVRLKLGRDAATRAELLREAAVFVPAIEGSERLRLEAEASGAAIASPPGIETQPELAAAAVARLAENDDVRAREQAQSRTRAEKASFETVAKELDGLYRSLARKRRTTARRDGDPLHGRPWITVDLHMHTNHSHDCSIAVPDLLEHAESIGLGAIAVTDHNKFGGALEAQELARRRKLIVIPGEEVKTDTQGEVIGLFLSKEIPKGMSFADTISAIRAQGGLVYLPHPFDRLHAIPDPRTLHRHLADIDVFEVYNARLLRESFNDEALRFAQKYDLTMGAGSDAHVLLGVGAGAVRMRAFNGPEEFLVSLGRADILRRPRSLIVQQVQKWAAQAKERVR